MRRTRLALAVLVILTLVLPPIVVASETTDPDSDGSQYAWSENPGWINAEPLGNGGPGMNITTGWVDGWLWSENLGWISLSCKNTGSCATVDYRVEHDGAGNLYGYAWAENAGWISFSCLNTGTCATVAYGVVVDRATGELSGYAWGENIGWISFSCTNTASCASVDHGIKTTVPLPIGIFLDGFETGDTSAWSGRHE